MNKNQKNSDNSTESDFEFEFPEPVDKDVEEKKEPIVIRAYHFVRRIPRKIARRVQHVLNPFIFTKFYPWYYKKCAATPLEKGEVLFVEPMYFELSNNLQLLYNELEENYDFHVRTLIVGHARTRWIKKIFENISVIKEIADAEYIFISNTSSLINVLPLRKETKLVQTWHGCGAFKKFGFSIGNGAGANDNYELFKLHSNYTHVFVSGTEAVEPYVDAMRLQNKRDIVHPDGVSRTDVFFDEAYKEAAFKRLYELYPQVEGKKIILWAPTYRGAVRRARSPKGFKLDLLHDGINSDEYVVFIKRHPLVKKHAYIPDEVPENFVFDVTETLTIDELLFVSDICISDYSSLVFEYSLFNRPMIFFTPDLEDYYDRRGFYYPFKDFVCGPICYDIEQVIDAINSIDSFDLERVAAFKEKFMNGCDGHATQRILNRVFGEEKLKSHRQQ